MKLKKLVFLPKIGFALLCKRASVLAVHERQSRKRAAERRGGVCL